MRAAWCWGMLVPALAACELTRTNHFTDSRAGDALRVELAAHPVGAVAEVHRAWTRYLESKDGRFDCRPSEYWLASEQGTWTTPDGRKVPLCYDLAGSMIGPQHKYEVIRIEAVRGTREREYRITTRFRFDGRLMASQAPHAALVTVFAVRQGDDWKLSGAMRMLTRSWRRETVGPFTYVIRPGQEFSRVRAQQAVAFADSLANALGVPRIQLLHYYLVRDGDEMLRLFGYQPDTTYGTPGGRSLPGIIISADPAFGENHGHEIAHHLIQTLQGPRLHIAASEGVPTWLGGTRSMRYPDALGALHAYLLEHPSATLDTLLASNTHPMHNPAAALLAAMAHERGGVSAIRQFLDSGPSLSGFMAGAERIFGTSWPSIAREWRRRALLGTR